MNYVQAVSSIIQGLGLIVLIMITRTYTIHTKRLADLADKQRQDLVDQWQRQSERELREKRADLYSAVVMKAIRLLRKPDEETLLEFEGLLAKMRTINSDPVVSAASKFQEMIEHPPMFAAGQKEALAAYRRAAESELGMP
jgi:hypothetical protein